MIKCCEGCGARAIGCHIYCKTYLHEKERYNAEQAEKRKIVGTQGMLNGIVKDTIRKRGR